MKNLWNKLIDMPPVWLVFFMIIAYVQTRVFNPLGFTSSGTNLAGWILIVLGFIVFGWSIAQLARIIHQTRVISTWRAGLAGLTAAF
jgi:predicted permease